VIGSPLWMAPEIYSQKSEPASAAIAQPAKHDDEDNVENIKNNNHIKAAEGYSFAIDIYSFGILAWQVVTACEPFNDAKTGFQLRDMVVAGARPSLEHAAFSNTPAGFTALLARCWHSDPRLRPSADEVVRTLGGCLDLILSPAES
jgi:serine/threonine protein kinase